MKILLKSALISLFIITTITAHAQKFDKYLKKIDKKYDQGNYEKAEKLNEKFRKKVQKKLSMDHVYLADYFLNKAKIELAAGELASFDSDVLSAIMISDQKNGNTSIPHAINLVKAAEMYMLYGNYVNAQKNIDLAQDIFTSNDALTGRNKLYIRYLEAKILAKEGFYREAIAVASEINREMLENIITRDNMFNPLTRQFEMTALPQWEVEKRAGDYARLLFLTGTTYGDMGEYAKADSAFDAAETYIRKKYSRADPIYLDYQTDRGLYEMKRGNLKESQRLLSYAYRNAKARLKPTHYLIYESHKNLIENYLKAEKDARAYNEIKAFYAEVRQNHSELSYYTVMANLVMLRRDLGTLPVETIYNNATTLLSSRALPAYHRSRLEIIQFLYSLTIFQNNFRDAKNYLDGIVEIRKNLFGEKAPMYHFALLDLGNFFVNYTNNVDSAFNIYLNSYENIIKKEISDSYPGLDGIMKFSASVYEQKDMLDKAMESMEKYVWVVDKKFGNESKEYAIALTNKTNLDIQTSQLKDARESIDKSLDILKGERDEDEIAFYTRALQIEAKLNNAQGFYDDATRSIRRSERLSKRATINAFDDLDVYITQADIDMSLGRFQLTSELLNTVIGARRKLYGSDTKYLVQPLLKLADLQIIQGEYAKAEDIIQEAQGIASKVYGEQSLPFNRCLILRAKLNQALGDNERAENYVGQALAYQKKVYGINSLELANTLSLIGQISYYQGKPVEQVEKYFLDAEKIIITLLGSQNPLFAENLKNLGIIYYAKKEYDRALNLFQQSKTIWEYNAGKRNNINTADIDVLIGDVYYMKRDYKNAEDNYKDAQKLYKRFFSDSHPKYVKTLSKLSKVSYMQGNQRQTRDYLQNALDNYKIFISDYFATLSEREKAKFWNSIKSDFEFFNTVALKYQDRYPELIEDLYNNALLTKAMLLNSSIKIRQRILNSSDQKLKDMYNEWKDKKELLTNVLSMSPEELTEANINPGQLKDDIEELERQLSEKTEGFAQTFEKKPVTWQNVKMALKPNEVAIEMQRFRYFDHIFTDSVVYIGLYIDNESSASKPKYILFKDGREMEAKFFASYRNSIRFRIKDDLSYPRFWKPFETTLGKSKTIYLSPDGVFNQVNLEAIPTPDGKYVLDNSNIILVNNTKDIYFKMVKSRAGQDDNNATLVGNPKFYASADKKVIISGSTRGEIINELPGTEIEVAEITELLKSNGWDITDYVYDDASENNLKNIHDPKLFHVATHGFFTSDDALKTQIEGISLSEYEALENPLLRTGLLLKGAGDLLGNTSYNYNIENGILTAYEAMNLNLDHTELVVLSACETGLGDIEIGEGVYGLQRAFLVAGAECIIMSLFKVSDEATQKLMVRFYEKWLMTGNKRQSFIEAKKEIRTEFKDPIYWGAFVMIGLDY